MMLDIISLDYVVSLLKSCCTIECYNQVQSTAVHKYQYVVAGVCRGRNEQLPGARSSI